MRLRLFLAALLVVAPLGSAQAAETALTATRVIYPGEAIEAGAVTEVAIRNPKRRSAFDGAVATRLVEVEGKVARRTLLPGRPIPIAALREAWLVEQGKAVEARFDAGVLSISATVVALQSGSAGDLIRLRNPDSGKSFSGTVMGDGSVLVGAAP